jgi:hypothetical protein
MMAQTLCPKCRCQLEVKLIDVSGPRSLPEPEEADLSGLEEMLETINVDNLDPRALDFVIKTRERFEKWGKTIRMSPKQMKWLRSIAAGKANKDNWE